MIQETEGVFSGQSETPGRVQRVADGTQGAQGGLNDESGVSQRGQDSVHGNSEVDQGPLEASNHHSGIEIAQNIVDNEHQLSQDPIRLTRKMRQNRINHVLTQLNDPG